MDTVFIPRVYISPTRCFASSVFNEKSPPAYSLAASVVSQAIVFTTHSGGICADQSSWLIGLIPEFLMLCCMSVATVSGDKPITRIFCAAHSLCAHFVSDKTAALVAQ